MKSLYMFFIGGTAPGANIEVHDVQFAVVDKPEDAHDRMAANWFGDPKLLHIDAQQKIDWIDGHDVRISGSRSEGSEKLFFVNLGGYIPGDIEERHSYDLIVASDKNEAKQTAMARCQFGNFLLHKDISFEVDTCIQVSEVDGNHIVLTPNPHGKRDEPTYPGTSFGKRRFDYDAATGIVRSDDGTILDDTRSPAIGPAAQKDEVMTS